MVLDVAALDRAADGFASVAVEADGWAGALHRLARAVGARGAIVLPIEDTVSGPLPTSADLIEARDIFVRSEWFEGDLRRAGIPQVLGAGGVLDAQLFPERTLRSHPYFQDFLRPLGIGWFAGVGVKIAGRNYCLSIQRDYGAAPFSPDDLKHLMAVAPRISMNLTVLGALDRLHQAGAADALEVLSEAAFLVDRAGRVMRTNAAAGQLLGNGLSIVDGRLGAEGPDGAAFGRHVAAVLRDWDGPADRRSGVAMQIRRPAGRPLVARVQRMRSDPVLGYLANAWGIVMVSDPDRRPVPAEVSLAQVFGLTRKEAEICRLLVETDGNTSQTSEQAQILYQTLRSHLKNIHSKTGTRTLTELVALLCRLPG